MSKASASGLDPEAVHYSGETTEDWRGDIDAMEKRVSSDDVIVVQPNRIESRNLVDYYYDGPSVRVVPIAPSGSLEQRHTEQLDAITRTDTTVWFVRFKEAGPDTFPAQFGNYSVRSFDEDGLVVVYRLDPPDSRNRTDTTGADSISDVAGLTTRPGSRQSGVAVRRPSVVRRLR
ncbi:hypothetical protein [Halorussus marinus]|uniref:hypothetical protein n=1 Tax=Halorussus marinus TaxID=2505976 RepID=UPI00106DE559|nr:hypothetical protein [Halorussus marinus]